MLKLKSSELPPQLLQLPQPPEQLYVSGEGLEDLMLRPRLAVVGSRKITPYGRAVTEKIVNELTSKGVVIVSGLALGADSVAHAACVKSGGQTIAVLPAGLDKIYPTSHNQLAQRIVSNGGLLITEYPPRTEPFRPNFLARNRIIAALSEGILIPEAASRSGSLNTARYGLELGRPVLAIPGPITSPLSEGTNNLIKSGAVPVTSEDDIVAALGWHLNSPVEREIQAATSEERIVLELINSGVSDGTELLLQCKMGTAQFNQTLTMLEITGKIRPLGNNQWSLI